MAAVGGPLVIEAACCTAIVKLRGVDPKLLVAVTVAVNEPATVGVPESKPAELNVNSGGRLLPVASEKVAAGGPTAMKVKLYAVPIMTVEGGAPLTNSGARSTVIVKLWVAAVPTPLLAFTVPVKVPVASGMPESTPAGDKLNPAGRVPEAREKVGVGEPVAWYVKL